MPDVKIIIVLRNPIDRAYSGYWHSVHIAGEKLSFERAIEIESERIKQNSFNMKFYSYVYRGDYFCQLKPYFDIIPRSRIFVLISEEYFSNTNMVLKQITDFLNVSCDNDFLDSVGGTVKNEGRSMRSAKLQQLYPYLRKRVYFLARVLNRMNKKKAKYPPMSLTIRLSLEEHFAESIAKLEQLLDRDLNIWRNASNKIPVL